MAQPTGWVPWQLHRAAPARHSAARAWTQLGLPPILPCALILHVLHRAFQGCFTVSARGEHFPAVGIGAVHCAPALWPQPPQFHWFGGDGYCAHALASDMYKSCILCHAYYVMHRCGSKRRSGMRKRCGSPASWRCSEAADAACQPSVMPQCRLQAAAGEIPRQQLCATHGTKCCWTGEAVFMCMRCMCIFEALKGSWRLVETPGGSSPWRFGGAGVKGENRFVCGTAVEELHSDRGDSDGCVRVHKSYQQTCNSLYSQKDSACMQCSQWREDPYLCPFRSVNHDKPLS